MKLEKPNLLYLKNISKGDASFENKIIDILNEEFQEEVNYYYYYFKSKDYNKVKIYVHRIKHKMSILGLEKSYKLTNIFENSIRNLDFENQEYFENMLPIMLQFLKSIK